jgi:putative membrane protein
MTRSYSISIGRFLRGFIFMGFSFFVTWLVNEGKLGMIVHPRMHPWIVASGLLSLALSASEMLRLETRPRRPDSASFYCPMIAVVAVVYIYAQTGGATPRDFSPQPELTAFQDSIKKRDEAFEEAQNKPLAGHIVFDDDHYWPLYNRLYDDPKAAEGKVVTIQGFVYRQAGLPPGAIIVARNLMWCCSADMSVIGLAASGPGTGEFPEDAWVEATGTLAYSEIRKDGDEKASLVPVIMLQSVRKVERLQSTTIFPY